VKNSISRLLTLAAALLLLPVLSAAANEISVRVNPEGGGVVTGSGTYPSGDAATLTALPGEGYQFLGWYEDDVLISQDRVFPFIVLSNRAFEARFAHTAAPSPPPSPEPETSPGSETSPAPSPARPTLPQTGTLWWPVPLLIGLGALLVIFGGVMIMRKRK
jgi:LPXTG-motif cell wall-anchored protein